LARVIHERREEHGFLLTAWVFLPDHGHAIFNPRKPVTISRVMESIKVDATKRINRSRQETGLLWQPRFFDRAVRTVKEYHEKMQYIHLNPVKARLVNRPEDWPWSSVHDYAGTTRPRTGDPERSRDRPRAVARRRAHAYLMPCERPSATAAR